MAKGKKGLGRGLGALYGSDVMEAIDADDELFDAPAKTQKKTESKEGDISEIKLIDIEPNRNQPRKSFDAEALEALADSIKTHGLIQPILVSPTGNETYRIIAGERRWRAAKLAGLKTVPCIVREYKDREISEIALVENLQREDLNPLEEAEGYQNLMDKFGLTQEEISARVGKSRSAVANALRLNNLPPEVKKMVTVGELSAGHARTILGAQSAEEQIRLAQTVISEGLSVRQTEQLVKRLSQKKPAPARSTEEKALLRYYKDVEKSLSDRLGAKVRIVRGSKKSKIEIEYYTKDDFERLLDIL